MILSKIKTLLPFTILLIPFLVNPWGTANPSELTKLVFLILFIGIFLFAVGLKLLLFKNIKIRFNLILYGMVGVWLFSMLLSVFCSSAPIQSFFGDYLTLKGFVTYFLILLLFIIFLNILHDIKNQKIFIEITKVVGIIVSLYGIIQLFLLDKTGFMSDGQMFAGRIYSTLGNPNDLGQFLIFPIAFAFAYFVSNFKKIFSKRISIVDIFNILTLLTSCTALFLSKNRATIISLFIVLVIYLFFKIKTLRNKLILGVLIVLIVLGGYAGNIINKDVRSTETRITLWQSTFNMIDSVSVFGKGLDNYYKEILPFISKDLYKTEKLYSIPEDPHNILLSILVNQGFLGLILFLSFVIFGIFKMINKREILDKIENQVCILAIISMLFTMLFSYFNITELVFFAFCLGILSINLFEFKEIEIRNNLKYLFAIILVIVSFIFINFSSRLITVDVLFNRVLINSLKDKEGSLIDLNNISKTLPMFAYIYNNSFLFYNFELNNKYYYEQLTEMNKQIGNITNQDFSYYINEGILAYSQNNFTKARAMFTESVKKGKNVIRIHSEWADYAYRAGDLQFAHNEAQTVLDLAPPIWKYIYNSNNLTTAQKEEFRIFQKSNISFWDILQIYEKTPIH